MDPNGPSTSLHRDGRLVVSHDDPETIRAINRQVATINAGLRTSNSDALPALEVTDMASVHDIDTQSFHSILVHRLDYRPQPAAAVGNVVVFSEPAYAARRTEKLQLATPAYYRTDSELRRLRSDFRTEYGYSAATRIDDPDAFAVWLGVNFALALDKTADVSLGPIDEIGYARSRYETNLWQGGRPIDTVMHVYHGPVHYEDVSGRVDRQEHWSDPYAGPRAWFTKKTSFKNQSEYRFAVSTLGDPVAPKHYIAVAPELRELTFAL